MSIPIGLDILLGTLFLSALSLCSFPRKELRKKKFCMSQGMMLMVHVHIQLMEFFECFNYLVRDKLWMHF